MKQNFAVLIFVILITSVCTNSSAETPPLVKTYKNQMVCEKETGMSCYFIICDHIPTGRSFDETCTPDFVQGWQPRKKDPALKEAIIIRQEP